MKERTECSLRVAAAVLALAGINAGALEGAPVLPSLALCVHLSLVGTARTCRSATSVISAVNMTRWDKCQQVHHSYVQPSFDTTCRCATSVISASNNYDQMGQIPAGTILIVMQPSV